MGKSKTTTKGDTKVYEAANQAYQQSKTPTDAEKDFVPISQEMYNNYKTGADTNKADYNDISSGYKDFSASLAGQGPTKFSFQNVSAPRPGELGEAYGYLREAMPGYRDFAQTGGYSAKDIQELRARGISPIRSAYGNTTMQLDRSRALGAQGGSANYIAALSRAQRELPEQMANAMTNVNAGLAESIRSGKQFGLQGITGTGAQMGGLSSQEAQRQLQAALANQSADIQTQGMGEQSRQNMYGLQLGALQGRTGLYGTTPGMANTFGNQALNAWGQRMGAENARANQGLGYLGLAGQQGTKTSEQSQPWYQSLLQGAGSAIPYIGGMLGGMGGGTQSGVGNPGYAGSNNGGFGPGSPGYAPGYYNDGGFSDWVDSSGDNWNIGGSQWEPSYDMSQDWGGNYGYGNNWAGSPYYNQSNQGNEADGSWDYGWGW